MVYDPRFIVTFADRLYAQANRVIALVTLLGSIVGVAGGFAVDNVLRSLSKIKFHFSMDFGAIV